MTAHPQLRVTLGPCDDMRAELFLQLTGEASGGWSLVGDLSGPWRRRDVTLPTTSRLMPLPERGSGGTLSRAILTEPAYWTPELPNRYRLSARLISDSAEDASVECWIGLRRLGVRGRSFWLDGRRWVPRGAVAPLDVATAKSAGSAIVIESFDEEVLAECDAAGVAVVAVLPVRECTPSRLASLACHPSVMLAVVTGDVVEAIAAIASTTSAKGTLQIGIAISGASSPPASLGDTDFLAVMLPASGVPELSWRSPPARPLVAWRRGGPATRADCDTLQRNLAHWGLADGSDVLAWDWAGYLVG